MGVLAERGIVSGVTPPHSMGVISIASALSGRNYRGGNGIASDLWGARVMDTRTSPQVLLDDPRKYCCMIEGA